MIVSKLALRRTLGSDLKRVDSHVVKPHEYKELPELTEDMLARATLRKGGRPKSENPRQMISLRLPPDVIERWKATGHIKCCVEPWTESSAWISMEILVYYCFHRKEG